MELPDMPPYGAAAGREPHRATGMRVISMRSAALDDTGLRGAWRGVSRAHAQCSASSGRPRFIDKMPKQFPPLPG